jgi:DNA-binding transcriptional MerR regulator
MTEYGIFAKEVALHLNVNTNTLRRWAIELEEQGYMFSRNDKNQRIYYKHDILALSDFQKMIKKTQSLEITAKAIATRVNDKENTEKMLSVMEEPRGNIAFTIDEFDDLIRQIAGDAAEKTADHLSQKFTNIMEQRDRKLMHDLTQSMQQTKLEIAAASVEEEKPGFFARIFKKGEKV